MLVLEIEFCENFEKPYALIWKFVCDRWAVCVVCIVTFLGGLGVYFGLKGVD